MVTIRGLISLLIAVFAYWRAFLVPQHQLALEIMALRQQLAVFRRKQPRLKLQRKDRLFWVALRHVWSGWAEALIVVKPETAEVRQLIGRLKAENPS